MSEIREMTDPEVDHLLEELSQEKLNMKIQSKTGQLENPARINQIRKDIARIKTEKAIRAATNQQPAETETPETKE